jgi:hypothetical protein
VLSGGLPWARGLILFPSQILGAICAAAVVSVMFPPSISIVNTVLAPGTSIVQGLFMEMFLTCLLMITVLMLAAEKSKDTFLAPIGIGLALFVAELAGMASFLPSHGTNLLIVLQAFTTQAGLLTQPGASDLLSHLPAFQAIIGYTGWAQL